MCKVNFIRFLCTLFFPFLLYFRIRSFVDKDNHFIVSSFQIVYFCQWWFLWFLCLTNVNGLDRSLREGLYEYVLSTSVVSKLLRSQVVQNFFGWVVPSLPIKNNIVNAVCGSLLLVHWCITTYDQTYEVIFWLISTFLLEARRKLTTDHHNYKFIGQAFHYNWEISWNLGYRRVLRVI